MDQAIRNRLRTVVTQCRRLLEEAVSQVLQGQFGVFATGKKGEVQVEAAGRMGHLSEEDRGYREQILVHFEHLQARGGKPADALEQLIREVAFTHLNRLCAYKMMERREVWVGGHKFRESVSRGVKSQGFLFYLADHPEDERRAAAGQEDIAYKHFLQWLGGTLSEEIGVLFSPTDPANRLFPTQRVLEEVLGLLNGEDLKDIWIEDETIGWVYQYFTPKEQRDQARKESQAPRHSYELAFRNQFFTPRYVVEFLTDNTLGRLWYEMRKGDTRLKDGCRYLVRRPTEVFLRWDFGDRDRLPLFVNAALRGDFSALPETPTWDEINPFALLIDGYGESERHGLGDCGEFANARLEEYRSTGQWRGNALELWCCLFFEQRRWRHFGYAPEGDDFAAILSLYRTLRRELTEAPGELSQEELLKRPVFVPLRLPKDPREIKVLDPACGSGHFLLYCFALLLVIYEETYDDPELGPGLQGEYPTKDDLRRALPDLILRHNLHGIDIDLRCTQIAALALWLRCQRAYQEMGFRKDRPRITKSNIVCAEPMPGEGHMLKEFVAQIEPKLLGQLVEVVFDKMKLAGEAGSLLKIEEEIRDAVAEARRQWRIGPATTQMRLFGDPKPVVKQQQFDLSGITEAQFFEQAEAKVVDALRSYSEQAQNGQRLQRRLFADDSVQGFAFVDLCHKRFDVVLMNPPFGLIIAKLAYKQLLQRSYPNCWTDYFLAFIDRARNICAITGMVGAVIPNRLLDAKKARATRDMLSTNWRASIIADFGRDVMDEAAVDALLLVAPSLLHEADPCCFFVSMKTIAIEGRPGSLARWSQDPEGLKVLSLFRHIPGMPFSYNILPEVLQIWRTPHRLDPDLATVATGGKTFDDERFLRLRWEIAPPSLNDRWLSVDTGGDYQPWVSPPLFTEDWQDDGRVVRENAISRYGTDAQVMQSSKFWLKPGLAYPYTSSIGFGTRIFPAGTILSTDAIAVSPNEGVNPLVVLGSLSSSWAGELLTVFGDHRKTENSSVKSLPLHLDTSSEQEVGRLAKEAVGHLIRFETYREVSPYFFCPPGIGDISELAGELRAVQGTLDDVCRHLFSVPDGIIPAVDHTALIPTFVNEPTSYQRTEMLLSYCFGVAFGRWDVRRAVDPQMDRHLPDPFEVLPSCSPGMLQGAEGLPATHDTLLSGYPVEIGWDGIMTDDADHPDDIIRRVRDVLEVIWKDRTDAIEKEAWDILGVADLRDYFRKPGAGGLWDDHIKRYSKSRRKAPIYWLLQSSKKNYALWIYYHRLDKDILFKALHNYVEPKIRREDARLDELRSQKCGLDPSAKGAKKFDKEIDRQEAFLSELRDFEDKLRRAANLHLAPDLNDGVVLNIAPLHELVPWKEAKSYWEELLAGKYEWSSIGKQLRERGIVP